MSLKNIFEKRGNQRKPRKMITHFKSQFSDQGDLQRFWR